MKGFFIFALTALVCAFIPAAQADELVRELVRLGNVKCPQCATLSYLKEIAPKHGLTIDERVFAKGPDIQLAMIAGEIDAGASALEAAIAGRAGGAPIYAVAGVAKGRVRILARNDAGIQTFADLKGRKIGVSRGGAQELALIAALNMQQLSWSHKPGKDIQIIYIASPDLNDAIIGNHLAVIAQCEPYASQLVDRFPANDIPQSLGVEYPEQTHAMIVSERFYTQKPKVAQRLMAAFVEATDAFLQDPSLARRYLQEEMFKGRLSSRDFDNAMSNARFTTELSVEQVETATRLMQLASLGHMSQAPVAADWVKTDLLRQVSIAMGK